MKKLFTLFLAFVASVGILRAYDFQVGNLYYNILTFQTNAVEVTCELEYDYSNYSGLTTVEIPNTVTYQGTTYSVTGIGDNAFFLCNSLNSLTFGNSVISIGDNAFCSCSSLNSVNFGNSVTSIGENAFSHCSSLTTGNIPNSVTAIGSSAFSGCSALTSITIPNGITYIANYAFHNCSSLTSIAIPNSVYNIEEYAFYGCSSLTSVTIPNGVTQIGTGAFGGCSDLTSLTIPNSVTSIAGNVISSCPNITSIIVESGNAEYDSRENCNAIISTRTNVLLSGCKNTVIPNSVTKIGRYAFSGSIDLSSITIPDNVTIIDQNAFSGCSSLTSITIPKNVTGIGWMAFTGCEGLTTVTCEAITPPETIVGISDPSNASIFWELDVSSIPLYVPAQSIEAYKGSQSWRDFKIIKAVEIEEALPEILTDENAPDGKFMIDGILYIRKAGHVYDINGQEMH